MGRPRQHGEHTRAGLLTAARAVATQAGHEAISVRVIADAAGTTTRAVYTVFGSKDGLLAALAQSAYAELAAALEALPQTNEPISDLVDVGAVAFRTFVREHPALYRVAFQRATPGSTPGLTEARARVFALLDARVRRAHDFGLLGDVTVLEVAVAFTAMCEGLANAEIRGGTLRIVAAGEEERSWRDPLTTLLRGFAGMTVGLAGVEPATSTL